MRRPVYSPSMLRLFLEARIVARMIHRGEDRRTARDRLFRSIGKAAGLSQTAMAIAYRGFMIHSEHRAAIWMAMGYPAAEAAISQEEDTVCGQ